MSSRHSIPWNGQTIWKVPTSEKLRAFITPSSSSTESVVADRHLSNGKNQLTRGSVIEMPVSETVFQEFMELNMHAHIVDIRCSFLPPLCTRNQA